MDTKIPRGADKQQDYSREMALTRRDFIEGHTGAKLEHVGQFSFDPGILPGNVEHFTGVAQVPIGFAGPLLVNGEHAHGEFYVPLATTEGTLVASYNRGMKLLHENGGVLTTISEDMMQRAPVFIFNNSREARDFKDWVMQPDTFVKLKEISECTTSVGKLKSLEDYISNNFVYLRFNFYTGDAAGQNMVGKATFYACEWIKQNYTGIRHYYLESNFATDKKGSQINVIRTRGKRVTAEATIKRESLERLMNTSTKPLVYHHHVANVGGFMSHVNNNGAHSANAITAIFIATGQDVANVAESSAGVVYCAETAEGDLYISITIPSLIVASYGGGTGLPTQRECLDAIGCYGSGKVKKLAEIVAATVLAGELSLASAISSMDWVSSHDQYGRNRP